MTLCEIGSMMNTITKKQTTLRAKRKFMHIVWTKVRVAGAPKPFKVSVIRCVVKEFVMERVTM